MNNLEYPKAVKRVAIAYLVLFFSVRLGFLEIIPNWLAYWMIYRSLANISLYEKSSELLKPLAIVLGIYEFAAWLLPIFDTTIGSYMILLIVTVLSLYFHYQLLTNLADIAQRQGHSCAKRIRQLRNARTVLITINLLPISWNVEMAVIMIIVGFALTIWLTCTLCFYAADEKYRLEKMKQI